MAASRPLTCAPRGQLTVRDAFRMVLGCGAGWTTASASARARVTVGILTHSPRLHAFNAPVLHLRHVEGGDIVGTYVESFDRVWATGTSLE